MRRDALRPPFMAVMDLLANPVTVAGAVSLDVEMPVTGVRRVRTGPQNGCLTIVASMLLFAFVVFRPVASDQIAAGALAPAE